MRSQALRWTIAAGDEGLVRLEVVEGMFNDVQVMLLAGGEVGRARAAKGVHVTVSVVGRGLLAVRTPRENVLVACVDAPILRVFPHFGKVPVFRIAGDEPG